MSWVARHHASICDLRADVLTLVLSFLDVTSLSKACSWNHIAQRLAAVHEHWHLFVLQFFGVYYEDYMRSLEVWDDGRWRRLFIYIRQVHHNVDQQNAMKRTMPALLRPCAWLGEAFDGAPGSSAVRSRTRRQRKRYRGSLEVADNCNVFFWENGRVVQVVRCSDGQVLREIDTGQIFRRCFHRLANVKNKLFVCLNDCIKVWEYDSSREPITLPDARHPGLLSRVGRPLELLVHRQRLILVESSCCLLWHTETLEFICCIEHDDIGTSFGRKSPNTELERSPGARDTLEVQWMGGLLLTWRHAAPHAGPLAADTVQGRGSQRSLNVWTLDGEPRAFLQADSPLVQVDVARVTWVSVYTMDHFILCALDSRSVITLWDSKAGFSPIFRFYSGCEEPFDLVLTQDFMVVIQDNMSANRLDLFFWKLWLHPDFEVEGQSMESSERRQLEGRQQREASVQKSRLPAGARFAPQGGAALPAAVGTGLLAVLDLASAAAAQLSGDALQHFLYKELRPNCRLIKTLSLPDVDTYFASYRNFLNVCSFHKSGQESLSVYRSSSLQKKVFFPPAKHTKFEEWIALQVHNDGTVVVYDFRPSQMAFDELLLKGPGGFPCSEDAKQPAEAPARQRGSSTGHGLRRSRRA